MTEQLSLSLSTIVNYLEQRVCIYDPISFFFNEYILEYVFTYYLLILLYKCWGFSGGSGVKNLPAMWETWI